MPGLLQILQQRIVRRLRSRCIARLERLAQLVKELADLAAIVRPEVVMDPAVSHLLETLLEVAVVLFCGCSIARSEILPELMGILENGIAGLRRGCRVAFRHKTAQGGEVLPGRRKRAGLQICAKLLELLLEIAATDIGSPRRERFRSG